MQMNISTPRCPHLSSLLMPFAFRASVVLLLAAALTATAFTNTNRPSVLPPFRGSTLLTAEFGGDRMVSPEVAHSAVQAGNAILLDVREFGEMAYSGACGIGHEHVPVMRWEHGMWLPRPQFVDKALEVVGGEGEEQKEVLVMSRDGGGRTTAAVKLLADAGVPAQGILGGWIGWQEAELPEDEDLGYGV